MAGQYRLDGGEYGTGKRIPLEYTRAIISAALNGKLETVDYRPAAGIWINDAFIIAREYPPIY